jgi:hypothetical protein
MGTNFPACCHGRAGGAGWAGAGRAAAGRLIYSMRLLGFLGAAALIVAMVATTLFILHRGDLADCDIHGIMSDRITCHASHMPGHTREMLGIIGQMYLFIFGAFVLGVGLMFAPVYRRMARDTLNGAAAGA